MKSKFLKQTIFLFCMSLLSYELDAQSYELDAQDPIQKSPDFILEDILQKTEGDPQKVEKVIREDYGVNPDFSSLYKKLLQHLKKGDFAAVYSTLSNLTNDQIGTIENLGGIYQDLTNKYNKKENFLKKAERLKDLNNNLNATNYSEFQKLGNALDEEKKGIVLRDRYNKISGINKDVFNAVCNKEESDNEILDKILSRLENVCQGVCK